MPQRPAFNIRTALAGFAFQGAVLFVSLVVFVGFIHFSHVNFHAGARVEEMIDGTASRPFVLRRLVPELADLLARVIPESDLIEIAEKTSWISQLFQNFYVNLDHVPEHAAVLAIMFASLVAYGLGLRSLWNSIYTSGRFLSGAVAVSGLAFLLLFFEFGFIYDFTTLALFTWALVFLARRNVAGYLMIYTVSTLNRETTLLLLPIYLLVMVQHMGRGRYVATAAAQATSSVVVYCLLAWRYRTNPGGSIDGADLHFWKEQLFAFRTLLPLLMLIAAALTWRWLERPPFLCKAAVIFFPLLVAYFVAGYPGEIRVFYEVVPVVTILLAANCLKAAGRLPQRMSAHELHERRFVPQERENGGHQKS